jgi:uncharacterized protein
LRDSGKVLGSENPATTTRGAQIVLWDDTGANDHLWRFA